MYRNYVLELEFLHDVDGVRSEVVSSSMTGGHRRFITRFLSFPLVKLYYLRCLLSSTSLCEFRIEKQGMYTDVVYT